MKIFVVENHPDTVKYLKMFLESLGHSVTTAGTMQGALEASATEDCQVLVSDIGLPDGDGWQLMEQAKFPKPVYAVAISGYAAEKDIERSKAAGFRRHIVKPFGGEDLRDALDEAAREIQAGTAEMPARIARPPSRSNPVVSNAPGLTLGQIAARLHQGPCQNLLGARLLLNVLRQELPQDSTDARLQVDKVEGVLETASAELTALMKELRIAPEADSLSTPTPSTAGA